MERKPLRSFSGLPLALAPLPPTSRPCKSLVAALTEGSSEDGGMGDGLREVRGDEVGEPVAAAALLLSELLDFVREKKDMMLVERGGGPACMRSARRGGSRSGVSVALERCRC